MRFTIDIVSQNAGQLGYDYRYHLASLVYATLAASSIDYCRFLHDFGFEIENRHFRLFTFSELCPIDARKWSSRGLAYNAGDLFHWQVSSPVSQFIREVAQGLFRLRQPHVGSMAIQFVDVSVAADPPTTTHGKFRTLSPVTMSVHDAQRRKHYLTPEEDWSEAITNNLRNKVEALTGERNNGVVTFAFDQAYIAQRAVRGKRVTKLCKYKDINIRAVAAPFVVDGNPQLIAMGYDSGFGDANPAGFGMVEYANVEERKR